ncbi:hypothetical protein M2454_002897 [Aequitasia blattaphilus]|nr:hypothetical protein [Aequitasia blattaphilus]
METLQGIAIFLFGVLMYVLFESCGYGYLWLAFMVGVILVKKITA